MRHRNRASLGIAICAVLLSGELSAREDHSPQEKDKSDEEVTRSETIDSGYVILDGRYLPPPYILEKRGSDLWVNDQLAISEWFVQAMESPRRPRGPGRRRDGRGLGGDVPEFWKEGSAPRGGGPGAWGGGPDFHRRRGQRSPDFQDRLGLRHLEHNLKNDGAIIAGEGLRGCTLSKVSAAFVVEILDSGDSHEEKLARLLEEEPHRMDESSWQRIVETFEPSHELMERIGPEIERIAQVLEQNRALQEAAIASTFWNSRPVKYVITLLAMGLVVAACGTLLNYRPQNRARWSEVDAEGEGIPVVVRSVVLLILLGIFDLACTLVAQQAGGFTEMNPLGSELVENPALLTMFKLTTLLMACGILYALRRYHGAQVASWWMCLLCTVLTFRWLTYNSMFMS